MKMLHHQKRVKFINAINGLNLFYMVAKELRTRGTVNVLISILQEVMVIAFASVKSSLFSENFSPEKKRKYLISV
ncbi:hypothetical protein TorRG33x02_113430 [Trema orientale]|uniref:Uncharacterized protein n=1 Tax=Trema orientale TaxID=63057 RepID=A0A2P5F4N0_TREOI|nr:hypothetical protein TorRG33x02_113430 [Trema orientale]